MGISPRGPEGYNPHRMYGGELEVNARESEQIGKEAEKIAPQILDTLPFVESVAHASKIDDERHGVDFILKMKGDGMVGVGFTVAENRKTALEDLRHTLADPIVHKLHNNDGEVYLRDPMPRVLLHGGRKERWGEIVRLYKEGKPIPESIMQEIGSFFSHEMLLFSRYIADNNKKVAPMFHKLALLVEKSLIEQSNQKMQ